LLRDDALLQALESDYASAPIDARRLGMLRYVDKLTRTPQAMTRADVGELRELGFNDVDVLQICEVASYYAYVNRIADGLGVELEDWLQE
jgi:alkylhydroperoxidase family enzyme